MQYVNTAPQVNSLPTVSRQTQICPQVESVGSQVVRTPSTKSVATQLSSKTLKERVRSKGMYVCMYVCGMDCRRVCVWLLETSQMRYGRKKKLMFVCKMETFICFAYTTTSEAKTSFFVSAQGRRLPCHTSPSAQWPPTKTRCFSVFLRTWRIRTMHLQRRSDGQRELVLNWRRRRRKRRKLQFPLPRHTTLVPRGKMPPQVKFS